MQKIKLVFSIILYSGFLLQTNSQDLPLISIDTSNSWEYYLYNGGVYRIQHHQYYTRDTVIESNTYSIFKIDYYWYVNDALLFEIDTIAFDSKEVFVRIENGELYKRDEFGFDSLLFSSNWSIGDTIFSNIDSPNESLILKAIDTINYGSFERRVWYFSNNQPSYVAKFIEGVGGSSYNISEPLRFGYQGNGGLTCCYLEGSYVESLMCLLLSEDPVFLPAAYKIAFFPNPTYNGQLYISISPAEMKSLRYEVIDLSGCVVMEDEIKEQFLEVQIPNAKQGAYVVSIFRDSELITSKVIINK